jgi:hypothetical protein
MSKQLKLFPIYKCWVVNLEGKRLRVMWETMNKECAEEFKKSSSLNIEIEEVTREEVV